MLRAPIGLPSLLAALAACAIAAGCGGRTGPAKPAPAPAPTPAPSPEPPKAAPSLSQDVLPLFVRSCGACHRRDADGPAVANKVYYETKADVLGRVGKHIVPGKPEESGMLKVLNQSVKVGKAQLVMPPPGSNVPAWSEAELGLLAEWIRAGARDD